MLHAANVQEPSLPLYLAPAHTHTTWTQPLRLIIAMAAGAAMLAAWLRLGRVVRGKGSGGLQPVHIQPTSPTQLLGVVGETASHAHGVPEAVVIATAVPGPGGKGGPGQQARGRKGQGHASLMQPHAGLYPMQGSVGEVFKNRPNNGKVPRHMAAVRVRVPFCMLYASSPKLCMGGSTQLPSSRAVWTVALCFYSTCLHMPPCLSH